MIMRMYYSLKNFNRSYIVISIYQSCVTVTIVVGVTPCGLVEGSNVSQRPVSDILRINGGENFIGNLGVY